MRRYFLTTLVFLASCSPSTLSEWRVEGVSIVKNLVEELSAIESTKDLKSKKSSIQKKYNKLVAIIIEADKFEEGDETLRPESFYSDSLRRQYVRIYEMDGGRKLLFEIQKESLHKLDHFIQSKKA